MLRLLPKEEIQKKKADEKFREIQEGLKLAKRVDSLREIQSQEEASLAEFRKKTLESIHEETTAKAKERDSLISEVETLEKRKEEALQPLEDEWSEYEWNEPLLSEKEKRLIVRRILSQVKNEKLENSKEMFSMKPTEAMPTLKEQIRYWWKQIIRLLKQRLY